ncbi:MAG: glycosyltransferase family 4 protein [Chloroflexi bacterium]|nr:glycosyltransferase family 4 protein [Chloroflexota bacterium]
MRIAVDCRIAHYTPGGTGVYAARLTEALLRLRQAPAHRWLLLEAARAETSLVSRDQPWAKPKRLRTPSHHRLEQLTLPLELATERIDVLHSPDYIPPFCLLPLASCLPRRVITVHDLAFLRWPEFLTADSRRYFNRQIRRAVRIADRIIAVSNATKADLAALLDVAPDKIDVVYEAPSFDANAIKQADVPDDYVLFVGTLEPRKNLERLIEAFAQVHRHGYGGKLVLAGLCGWAADGIMAAIERHAEYVLNLPIDRQSLPSLYKGATLLAYPSTYEGFGIPLVEAMACGTPALISNVSSLPEIAGGSALEVDPNDVEAIAEGIWRLISDEALRQELVSKGLRRAAEFSWERAAEQTLAVYHRAT